MIALERRGVHRNQVEVVNKMKGKKRWQYVVATNHD